MKKIKYVMAGILLSSMCFVHAAQAKNVSNLEKPVSNITYNIKNVQQYGHSDGYTLKQNNGVEKKVFLGTNHYKAQMIVTNNEKQALINIMYSIRDPKVTGSLETENSPSSIVLSDETMAKNSSNTEIQKLQDIGLSKEEFDKEMHLHFSSVTYL